MRRPTLDGFALSFSLFLCLTLILVACERTQSVSLTTEDFRFTPQLVTASSSSPLVLTIYNSGREVHEFGSPVLLYAADTSSTVPMKEPGIVLEPGKFVRLAMALRLERTPTSAVERAMET